MARQGHGVVVVDNEDENFRNLAPDFNGIRVAGVPIDQDVLKEAGIESADALAAVTPDDNVNIMVSQVAKEIFKVPRVIARIYNPLSERVFHEFGLDTVCPTNLTVNSIYSMITGDREASQFTFGNNTFSFRKVPITPELEGRGPKSVDAGNDSVLYGFIRENEFKFIDKDTIFKKGDVIIVSAKVN